MVHLQALDIPPDAPVKLPWQAKAVLEELTAPPKATNDPAVGQTANVEEALSVSDGAPLFRSDVRLVNLTVAVYDQSGRPLMDLGKDDFEIFEDGRSQQVSLVGADETPFNLAVLFDLSGSTREDRAAMKEAAARFVQLVRPQDQVAACALANDLFHVVSRLTEDREHVESLIRRIPAASGGSPVYDAITLAYAEEFRTRGDQRNSRTCCAKPSAAARTMPSSISCWDSTSSCVAALTLAFAVSTKHCATTPI
jgi:hypothetical protein